MKTLNMFIHARILQQLGHARLAQFLDAFEADLKAMNLSAPPPLPATHFYFGEVADFLVNTENLPPRLLDAVFAIEAHANHSIQSSSNNATFAIRPETSDLAHHLALALDLWFTSPKLLSQGGLTAPGELASFKVQSSTVQGSTVQSSAVQSSTVPGSAPPTLDFRPERLDSTSSPIENGNGFTHPPIQESANPSPRVGNGIILPPGWVMEVEPSAEPVDGKCLLDTLRAALLQRVVMPKWVPETVALFIVHTYAFECATSPLTSASNHP